MSRSIALSFALLLPGLSTANRALAGGGPKNVVVVYNADQRESTALANRYATARGVPPAQLCGLSLGEEARLSMEIGEYRRDIAQPVTECLARVPEPEEIDYLVLIRGMPYSVRWRGFPESLEPRSWDEAFYRAGRAVRDAFRESPAEVELYYAIPSLLAALGVTRIADGEDLLNLPPAMSPQGPLSRLPNPFLFRDRDPARDFAPSVPTHAASVDFASASAIIRASALPPSFRRRDSHVFEGYDLENRLRIVTFLDGFRGSDVENLIDRSVAADGTFPGHRDGSVPGAEFLCVAGEPWSIRHARDPECELAVRHLAPLGFNARFLPAADGEPRNRSLVALITGAEDVRSTIEANDFVPGAIATNMTSYGAFHQNFVCGADGTCPAEERQTSILRVIAAAGSGVEGMSDEPMATALPRAGGILLMYASGYNLGESFFFNQPYLGWMNHLVADPLTTPFAMRPRICGDTATTRFVRDHRFHFAATHDHGIAWMRAYDDGRLVATSERGELSFSLPSATNSTHLLVVAGAYNRSVPRPEWPVEEQLVQADIQGWYASTIEFDDAAALIAADPQCHATPAGTAPERVATPHPSQLESTFPGWSRVTQIGGAAAAFLLAACFALSRRIFRRKRIT